MSKKNCSVCTNDTKYYKKISYFTYPKEVERRNSWLEAVGREDLIPKLKHKITKPYVKICEEHFEPKFIKVFGSKKHLIKDAFPTLRLRPKKYSSSTSLSENNAGTGSMPQDSQDISNNILVSDGCVVPSTLIVLNDDTAKTIDINSERQAEIVSELENGSQASSSDPTHIAKKSKHTFLDTYTAYTEQRQISEQNDIDNFISKGMSQLIKWQRESNRDNSDNNKSKSFICFAFHLHYLGSTTYRFLKNSFCLPPLKTLQELVKPRGTKIDDTLFSVLKIKVDKMGPQEKICSVCVSCVPIKPSLFYDVTHDRVIGFNDINGRQKYEPAQYAVVIVVRGIILNWKQLIGYAFLSQFKNDDKVSAWIRNILSHLLKIGFDIRALVSDHSDFLDLSKSLNVDNTYLFIRGQKIYYFFDVPRLINSLKNNLMTCNYAFEDKVAKWYHIKDMYDQDKDSVVRLAPKLMENHFQSSNSVELSAQVLSTTVAFAIKTLMQSNLIDSSARDTIELVLKLDKLFDLLNSSKLRCPNKFKTAFCGEDFQIDFLQEMLGFFRRLTLVEVASNTNVTNSIIFIKCIQITIKSLLHLFKDLQLQGIKSIYTRRLNLEPVDKFFDKVKQINEVSSKPTCRQVSQTFNKIFVDDILKEPVKKTCGNDYESLLAIQEDRPPLIEAFSPDSENVTPILLDSNDYRFELPQENGLLILSVYLYKKCLEKHTCETITTYVRMCEQELAECKNYTAKTHSALPNHFFTFIQFLDHKFCEYFNNMRNSNLDKDPNIGNEVLLLIRDFTFEAPCNCFPIEYLKELFVRSRIYHTLKKHNIFFKSEQYGKMPFDVHIF